RQTVVVVLQVNLKGEADLVKVAQTGGGAGGFLAAGKHRQQQRGQHAHDRDHDEKFNQCERPEKVEGRGSRVESSGFRLSTPASRLESHLLGPPPPRKSRPLSIMCCNSSSNGASSALS